MIPVAHKLSSQDDVSVRRQLLEFSLRAILDSRNFRNSKRFPALLEYAVHQSLEKNFHKLKERTIGVEVFGRPIDYDPGIDPVVRVAFGEMRKRLVIYYSEHPETPVRIDFPIGTYNAEFTFPDEASLLPTVESDGDAQLHPPAALPPSTLQPSAQTTRWLKTWMRRLRWQWLLAAALIVLAAAAFLAWRSIRQTRQLDFWLPIFRSEQAPAIIVGEGPSFDLAGQFKNPMPNPDSSIQQSVLRPRSLPMKLGNAQAVAQVCGIFRTYHQECRITSANLASFVDIRQHDVVLVGGINNFWSIRALEPLRYHFDFDVPNSPAESHRLSIVDREHPELSSAWSINNNQLDKASSEYAIIARFHSDFTEGNLIVLGGLGPLGTASAADFLSSPQNMRNVLEQAPSNWPGQNFEIVLQSDTVLYHFGHTKVVAAYFW